MPGHKSEAFDEPMTASQRQYIEKLLKFKEISPSEKGGIINWLEGREQKPTIGKAGQTITFLEKSPSRGKEKKMSTEKPISEASEAELAQLHKSVTGREPEPGRISPGEIQSEVTPEEKARMDNINWRKKEILSLGDDCSCMRHLTRDMLLFAVEDKIYKANEELTRLSDNIEKYLNIDPYWMAGWQERAEEALVEVETYRTLKEELRNIKICE